MLDAPGGMRIGLIADTHVPESRAELWPQVFDVFAGCDLIVHGGDMHELRVLDQLQEVAPVYAARGNGDEGFGGRAPAPPDDRVHDTWVLDVRVRAADGADEADGAAGLDSELRTVRIGAIHDLTIPEFPPKLTVESVCRRRFGLDPDAETPLDVLVYGDSHVERIDLASGVLCVNPGSPTLPHNLMTQLGTVGFLDLSASTLRVTLCQLTDDGCDVVHEHTVTFPVRENEPSRVHWSSSAN